jgi:hypothetical protein
MVRTIYAFVFGILIFAVAMTPPALLIIDKVVF